MWVQVKLLGRPIDDIDFSDIADRDGPALWDDNGLTIPFVRELTEAEEALVRLRVTSASAEEAGWRADSLDYLDQPDVLEVLTQEQVRRLTRLVLYLLDERTKKEGAL